MANKALDITGQRFGRLVAIRPITGEYVDGKRIKWVFKCDCGCYIERAASYIKLGRALSCGCLAKEVQPKANLKHGMTKTSMYSIWTGIKGRCLNPKNTNYSRYGGRGIKVCDRWLHSFENFLADMGERPSKEYSIDRIDNNGDYCPENCRWATKKEQANNRCSTHRIEYNNEIHSIAEISQLAGIDKTTLSMRYRKGAPPQTLFSKGDLRTTKRTLTDEDVSFIRNSGLKYKQCIIALGKHISEGTYYAAKRGRTYKNI